MILWMNLKNGFMIQLELDTGRLLTIFFEYFDIIMTINIKLWFL